MNNPSTINALMPTPEQIRTFTELPDDHPIVMVNLLKFKPDGGAAEYAKYAKGIEPILKKIGARLLFAGRSEFCLIGAGDWDQVALVEYPNKKALMDMSASPEYQAIHGHREEGLQGQVNYCVRQVV
jgi:uncharacterized protein (DUF1330 family)